MAEDNAGDVELPLDTVGKRLQRAREAAGLSRADVSASTRIAERHLAALEEERFSDFASSTYAIGFSRAYARAVGLDEQEVASQVRNEIAGAPEEPRYVASTFEPGDPARVPPSRTAWLAGLIALAVLAGVFVLWRSYLVPSISLPDLTSDEPPAAAPSAQAGAPQVAAPDPKGAVVFTSQADGIWVKFYDGTGKQLMQKQMAMGETYTVPADAQGPQIWTGRPEALAITIGGRPVPRLADQQTTVKNVAVSAAALLARVAAPVTPASAAPSGLATIAATPSVAASQNSTVSH